MGKKALVVIDIQMGFPDNRIIKERQVFRT